MAPKVLMVAEKPSIALSIASVLSGARVASSALGFVPQLTMQLAERLYTQGFISYPHTQSTAYPSSFDFKGTLGTLVHNPVFGAYAQKLLTTSYNKPWAGTDAGDHPPITPMRSASEDSLGNDAWKLYHYICQHFLGSLSPNCKYRRIKVELESGGEQFQCVDSLPQSKDSPLLCHGWLLVRRIFLSLL